MLKGMDGPRTPITNFGTHFYLLLQKYCNFYLERTAFNKYYMYYNFYYKRTTSSNFETTQINMNIIYNIPLFYYSIIIMKN
jgi:hypothetical protein